MNETERDIKILKTYQSNRKLDRFKKIAARRIA